MNNEPFVKFGTLGSTHSDPNSIPVCTANSGSPWKKYKYIKSH